MQALSAPHRKMFGAPLEADRVAAAREALKNELKRKIREAASRSEGAAAAEAAQEVRKWRGRLAFPSCAELLAFSREQTSVLEAAAKVKKRKACGLFPAHTYCIP